MTDRPAITVPCTFVYKVGKIILNPANNSTSPKDMFITVAYKDDPELSNLRRKSSEPDLSVEKALLVNPNCPVRIMLEYIRKKCRLGAFAQFDLCDENGILMGLFDLPTYAYTTFQFEHKKTYYIIVLKQEADHRISVLPQLNHENRIYLDLKNRVKNFMANGNTSPLVTPPVGKITPPGKVTPPKGASKKK